MAWFVTAMAVVIVAAILNGILHHKRTEETKQRIISRYKPGELFVSTADQTLVGINFDQQKVILGAGKSERVFRFDQIVSVEIIENGATITLTNRGSQALGVVVGGLALGGVGAIVGGLSGSSRSKNRLRGLSLKMIIDDRTSPVYSVCFFKDRSRNGADPDGHLAKTARTHLERMHAQMLNAMRRAQRKPEPMPLPSIADLEKLWELKQCGALTDDEYAEQKSRLLASGAMTLGNGLAVVSPTESATYSVILIECSNKINAIKGLREIRALSLREAKDIVDLLPATLATGVPSDDAETMKYKLLRHGCTVDLQPNG